MGRAQREDTGQHATRTPHKQSDSMQTTPRTDFAQTAHAHDTRAGTVPYYVSKQSDSVPSQLTQRQLGALSHETRGCVAGCVAALGASVPVGLDDPRRIGPTFVLRVVWRPGGRKRVRSAFFPHTARSGGADA